MCRTLTTDVRNCGACGVTCSDVETCSAGACVCAPGNTVCGGACTDTRFDASHCGACGQACAAGSVCTDGLCRAATADWYTFGADMQHTGVSSEAARPPAIGRFRVVLPGIGPNGDDNPSPVVVQGGTAFASARTFFSETTPLVAFSASNGRVRWTNNFGAVSSVGWPTVWQGAVYVQNGKPVTGQDAAVVALGAATGQLLWTSPIAAQWETYAPPIVVGPRLYGNSGYFGGISSVLTSNGANVFFEQLSQVDRWSPASGHGVVYAAAFPMLTAHDPVTGDIVWSWFEPTGDRLAPNAPVVSGTRVVVAFPPNLRVFDGSSHSLQWTGNGVGAMPAIANDIVYVVGGGKLRAFDLPTGNVLWTFDGDGALAYPPVVAAGYVYVSSPNRVYAVSIATHASVWSADVGGWLAVGAGRLFVSGPSRTVHGFVLTP